MTSLLNKKIITEQELRNLIKTLFEREEASTLKVVKINPVVDQSAILTDPSNNDYKPGDKKELQVVLSAMVDDLSDDKVSDFYDSLKSVLQSKEEDEGKEQMNKGNEKIEEAIRFVVRSLLENVKLPKRQIKEYYEKDPKTGEMVWKGKGPSPKLTPAADLQKLDPSARGLKVGAKSPAVKSLRATLNKMRDEEFSEVPSDAPQDGRSRKNKSGEVELKTIAAELGFKNPNGALQFMNRVLEKFKSRFENYDEVMIASLEIMKEYIDELSSPHKSGSTMQDPLITPQDAELMKQHPEMIKDLQTFRVYLNKKLRERGL